MGCDYDGNIEDAQRYIIEIERRNYSEKNVALGRAAILIVLKSIRDLNAMELFSLCRVTGKGRGLSVTTLQAALLDLIYSGAVRMDAKMKLSASRKRP